MKTTITLTFMTYDEFKTVRDFVELTEKANWRYGSRTIPTKSATWNIQFLNGTTPAFFIRLGGFLGQQNINPELA